jgi:hypothetical protein
MTMIGLHIGVIEIVQFDRCRGGNHCLIGNEAAKLTDIRDYQE